ncbi:MAG TPA: pyridoxamine 5'-phosphate oxidase [Chthoniobacterales bacterium]
MEPTSDVARLRKEYLLHGLRRHELDPDPVIQFRRWLEEALATAGTMEGNAMTVATATPDGAPSARVVLLKGFSKDGFVFYTNYESRKGRQLSANPRAALNFYWPWLERQVQVEGTASQLGRDASANYFNSRPLGSRFGALASRQSEAVASRLHLERQLTEARLTYRDRPPLPDYWGGYLVRPIRFEFWQGRENRLHDRFLYLPAEGSGWHITRLSP